MVSTPQKPPHSGDVWQFAIDTSPDETLQLDNGAGNGREDPGGL
jgi:hypothetical protein